MLRAVLTQLDAQPIILPAQEVGNAKIATVLRKYFLAKRFRLKKAGRNLCYSNY